MIEIDFYNKTKAAVSGSIFTKLLPAASRALVADKRVLAAQLWSIEVTLVGTHAITQLNTQYHNKHRPTDVVSVSYFQDFFEKGGMKGVDAEVGLDPLAGEIFISVPFARAQAKKIGQSLEEELRFLFIHGLLHVFGYDHMKPDEEAHMLRLTYAILGRKK